MSNWAQVALLYAIQSKELMASSTYIEGICGRFMNRFMNPCRSQHAGSFFSLVKGPSRHVANAAP